MGTRLVVLNIWKLGTLLLAEFKKIGGIFDDDVIPLKNFNWLISGFPAEMYVGFAPKYDFTIVCGITVCAIFELLEIKFCVVGYLSIGCFNCDDWKLPDDGNTTWFECGDGIALPAITTFAEFDDGYTGNGFKYCVTGGCKPLICRSICALWCAIWAIWALFVASKFPILINCGAAAAGIATGCHDAYF